MTNNLKPVTKHGNAAWLKRMITMHRETSFIDWFAPGAMEFFNSRIETGLFAGALFVTSEQFEDDSRLFTIRQFVHDSHGPLTVETFGQFQGFETLSTALQFLRSHS